MEGDREGCADKDGCHPLLPLNEGALGLFTCCHNDPKLNFKCTMNLGCCWQHSPAWHHRISLQPWFWTPSIWIAWRMPLCCAIPAQTSWNGTRLGFGTPVFYESQCLYYTLNLLNYGKDLFDLSMSLFLSMWASNQCVFGLYSIRIFDFKKSSVLSLTGISLQKINE